MVSIDCEMILIKIKFWGILKFSLEICIDSDVFRSIQMYSDLFRSIQIYSDVSTK